MLLFSGLSFAGYIARRLVGPEQGYLVTGLLGGLVSSTNVTLTFARTSRTDRGMDRALAFGAVGANAMLYPRVLVATAFLNPAVVIPLLPYLIPPALVAALVAAVGAHRSPSTTSPEGSPRNPLALTAALQMAAVFQTVMMVVYAARQVWGTSGVFASAAVLGLTDVDALTLSLARDVAHSVSPAVAATAIAIGVLTNTGMKLALALLFGSRRFKMIAGGALLLMLVALEPLSRLRSDEARTRTTADSVTAPLSGAPLLCVSASPQYRPQLDHMLNGSVTETLHFSMNTPASGPTRVSGFN